MQKGGSTKKAYVLGGAYSANVCTPSCAWAALEKEGNVHFAMFEILNWGRCWKIKIETGS